MGSPHPVALQVYSVQKEARQDLAGTLKRIAAMGYTGVEFAGLYGSPASEVKKMMDDLGLVAPSIHSGIPTEESAPRMIDDAKALGYTCHIAQFPGESAGSKQGCIELAAKYNKGIELMKAADIQVGIHNHSTEFGNEFDGKTAHQILLDEAPELLPQIDTYWVAMGGKDPVQVIRSLGPRIASLHIKDGPMVGGKAMTAVGDGNMAWGPIIQAADEENIEWLIVELDSCDTDMMEAVERSVKYLVDSGFGKAR